MPNDKYVEENDSFEKAVSNGEAAFRGDIT